MPEQVRLWTVVQRQNRTCRIDDVIETNRSSYYLLAMEELFNVGFKNSMDMRIFIQTAQQPINYDESKNPIFFQPILSDQKTVTFMIKHYDPLSATLQYLAIMTFNSTDKFASLLPTFSQYLKVPQSKIAMYEEIRPEMVERLDLEKTFEEGEIMNGDIIVFQIDYDVIDIQTLPEPALANVTKYYEYLNNRIDIEFVAEFPEQIGGTKSIGLPLSKTMSLEKVFSRLGMELNHDPSKIKLSLPNGNNSKVPIKSGDAVTLGDILGYYMHAKQNGAARIIYFELLDISLLELESKRTVSLYVLDETFKETGLEFLVSKLAKMSEISELIKEKMELESVEFRIFETMSNRKVKTFLPTDTVSILNEYATLYFQIIPLSEQLILSGKKEGMVADGVHFSKDTYRCHGVPFSIELYKVFELIREIFVVL